MKRQTILNYVKAWFVFARANILKEIKRHLAAGTGAGLQNAVLLWVRHRADFLPSLDLAGSFVNPEQIFPIILHPCVQS